MVRCPICFAPRERTEQQLDIHLKYVHRLDVAERRQIIYGGAVDASTGWMIKLDPANPNWPGVLVVGPTTRDGFIKVQAGEPTNFADSNRLAERIAAALSAGGTSALGKNDAEGGRVDR